MGVRGVGGGRRALMRTFEGVFVIPEPALHSPYRFRHDAEWLDRMYNNRALVPQWPAHFEHWQQASAQARESLECWLDLPYGADPTERLDVYAAQGSPDPRGAPVVVFVHGGYWRALDKADHAFVAPALVGEGACVVVPNYALCPAVTVPHIVMQMARAVAWTWRHIEHYGGDPARIVVAGHSAGGQVAAMLLNCVWPVLDAGLPEGLVRRALSISGLYDLEPLRHTPHLQSALQLTAEQVAQASPARLPRPRQGKLFSVVGGDESAEFLRQQALLRRLWGRHGVPVAEVLPGLNHFSALESLAQPGGRVHQLMRQLLRE